MHTPRPSPPCSFHPQHVPSTRAVATVRAVAGPIPGEQHKSSTVPRRHLLAAGAHHMRAPAQHEFHMDSCCSPGMGPATAQTVATARVDGMCWGWKERGGGGRGVCVAWPT